VKDYLHMSEITVINKEAVAPGLKTGPSNHAAWLEQLESAQWQQRLRYQPGSGQRQSDEPAAAELRSAQQPGRPGNSADFSQAAHAGHQAGAASDRRSQDVQLAVRIAAIATPVAESRPASGQGLPALKQTPVTGVLRDGDTQAWLLLRRPVTINWQAQNTHVMAGSDGLRMWLRDVRYEKDDGYRLLQELRGQFAHLGFRLAEFTLNGEQIAGSDESGQSDQKQ
jgi:hypothetical protein